MNITKEIQAKVLAAILNSEDVQVIMEDELGISGPLYVSHRDVLEVLNGGKEGISAQEIILALQLVCKVMNIVCPLVGGM